MQWTGSRSREEWLAEVERRGERIRRRRRLATMVVGGLALVLPVSALATMLGDEPDRGVELSAAGPAPAVTGDSSASLTTTAAVGGEVPAAGVTTEAVTQPSGGLSPTTTAEVHRRVATINGAEGLRSATALPPADDPVVRSAPSPPGPGFPTNPPTAVPPASDSQVGACPTAAVAITVTTEKGAYTAGETVRGLSTLENRSATDCLVPTRAFFRIEDGAGRIVGSFAYTAEFRLPVKAEPGKSFTSSFTWDQKDCSGSACAQAPAGTYVVVAEWTEGGPYVGRSPFRILP